MARPSTTVILSMSADGKIADRSHAAARFSSAYDIAHLEQQIAQADAVLFGASTLRAYGTTLRIRTPELLELRQQQHKPSQPTQIVCSRSGAIEPQIPFFRQPVPRWLLTTEQGADLWQEGTAFERILTLTTAQGQIDWLATFTELTASGIHSLAVLGGGTLVAALLEAHLIDEFWLTICPLLLGGKTAPMAVEGVGFLAEYAPRLTLVEARSQEQEVFLHYRVIGS